jgi:hypothetical protein
MTRRDLSDVAVVAALTVVGSEILEVLGLWPLDIADRRSP